METPNGRTGSVLVITLIVLTLVLGLTGALLVLATSESQASTFTLDRTAALAAAEAGAVLQYEAVRMGGGDGALVGSFGGGTYVASPALDLGNDCWQIDSIGTVGFETRSFRMYVGTESPAPLKAAFAVQGGGLLTAVLPVLGDWNVSGHDTLPPSSSGLSWDAPVLGSGPLGNGAKWGVIVHDGLQSLVIAAQMLLLPDPSKVSGTGGIGMDTVHVDPASAIDLASVVPQLRSQATIIDSAVPAATYGSPADPEVVFLENGASTPSLTGYGILVVRGDLVSIGGDLKWEGLVIHYAPGLVDLNLLIGGNLRIYGGVIVEDPNHLALAYETTNAYSIYSSTSEEMAWDLLPPSSVQIFATRVLD